MNDFVVLANEPIEIEGRHYQADEPVTVQADLCAPLLVLGKVRLTTTIPPTPTRPRRRYRRRDLVADA